MCYSNAIQLLFKCYYSATTVESSDPILCHYLHNLHCHTWKLSFTMLSLLWGLHEARYFRDISFFDLTIVAGDRLRVLNSLNLFKYKTKAWTTGVLLLFWNFSPHRNNWTNWWPTWGQLIHISSDASSQMSRRNQVTTGKSPTLFTCEISSLALRLKRDAI